MAEERGPGRRPEGGRGREAGAVRPREDGVPQGAVSAAAWVVGYHAVLATLEADAPRVEVVWLAQGLGGARARAVLAAARAAGVRFSSVARHQLDAVASGVAHNGCAARVAPVSLADPESLLAGSGAACLVGLDGLEDGHNLGAVVRVAAGLGLDGVVVGGPHPPPLGGAAAKVAAGCLPLVRVAHVGALGDFAVAARGSGFWVIGAAAEGEDLATFELPERLLLCVGAEAGGLRAKTRRALDGTVAIPLARGVESLNLSVAAGILAWEWHRRWARHGGPPRVP